jgi:(5-formylfuran-3-yl)methyl phosphate synthase
MNKLVTGVTTVGEAMLAVHEGVDLVELLDPALGTLGALDLNVAQDIVAIVEGRRPLSVCIGDFPEMDADAMLAAARRALQLEIDFLKIGFFGTPHDLECIKGLSVLSARTRLVGVVFADRPRSLQLIDTLAEWGFSAVVLDTAYKDGPSLRALRTDIDLALFVRRARMQGLLVGLSGSLTLRDLPSLLSLQADWLCFRGALCVQRYRTGFIDPAELRAIRAAIPRQPVRVDTPAELRTAEPAH